MSAIKNGIKELHCKESLSGKRFKRSIAHNNLKLTCNIYHIQVFKLPLFLQIGLSKITSTDSGDKFSSLLNSVLERMLKVLHCQINSELGCFYLSVTCILQRSANGEARRSTRLGEGRGWGDSGFGVSLT